MRGADPTNKIIQLHNLLDMLHPGRNLQVIGPLRARDWSAAGSVENDSRLYLSKQGSNWGDYALEHIADRIEELAKSIQGKYLDEVEECCVQMNTAGALPENHKPVLTQ